MVRLERFLDRPPRRPAGPGPAQDPAPLHDLAPAPAAARRNNGRPTYPATVHCAPQPTPHAAVAFLDWLDRTRPHPGHLPAGRPRPLAHRRLGHLPLRRPGTSSAGPTPTSSPPSTSPPIRWIGPAQPLDDQHRWDTARRLLHDDTLKPEDRLAGLLVLLYAQGATAISRMTIERRSTSTPTKSGCTSADAPIQLPEPVAALARDCRRQPQGPRDHRRRRRRLPGCSPAASPDGPISTAQLTQRLNNLGIRPNQARSTALFQLATEIPAAILARTLGIHTDVAVTWQRLSAGTGPTTPPRSANAPQRRTDGAAGCNPPGRLGADEFRVIRPAQPLSHAVLIDHDRHLDVYLDQDAARRIAGLWMLAARSPRSLIHLPMRANRPPVREVPDDVGFQLDLVLLHHSLQFAPSSWKQVEEPSRRRPSPDRELARHRSCRQRRSRLGSTSLPGEPRPVSPAPSCRDAVHDRQREAVPRDGSALPRCRPQRTELRSGPPQLSVLLRLELHSNDGILGDAREIHIEYCDQWKS